MTAQIHRYKTRSVHKLFRHGDMIPSGSFIKEWCKIYDENF